MLISFLDQYETNLGFLQASKNARRGYLYYHREMQYDCPLKLKKYFFSHNLAEKLSGGWALSLGNFRYISLLLDFL